MNIALFIKKIEPAAEPYLLQLEALFAQRGARVFRCNDSRSVPAGVDFILSIGGDGTLLSAARCAAARHTPVAGINFGHLGFLTTAGKEDVRTLVDDLMAGSYSIEERTMIAVTRDDARPGETYPLALNEVTVHRIDSLSLLQVEVYVNNRLVSLYSGDGVIVATPTGSTAYSLSCGGPILTPDCGCFVITPIAAHSLSLRPIIVPDGASLRLQPCVQRANQAMLTIDSGVFPVAPPCVLHLQRSETTLPLLRLNNHHFFTALHEKLAL